VNEKGSVRTVRGIKRHNDNQEHERSRWLGIKTNIIDRRKKRGAAGGKRRAEEARKRSSNNSSKAESAGGHTTPSRLLVRLVGTPNKSSAGLTIGGDTEQVVCWSHDWWAHRTSRLLVSRPVDTPNKSSAGLTTGGRYQDTDEQAG
jgi:hypothetical protein